MTSKHQVVQLAQEEQRHDDNPRNCPVFAQSGYHVYSAIDGWCVDCAKPNTRKTDNGK